MRLVISTTKLESERDVLSARRQARRLAQLLGFDEFAQTGISVAVSSVARVSLGAAPGVALEFAIEGANTQRLVVLVHHEGLSAGDMDTATMVMDSCTLENGSSPSIRMEKVLPAGAPRVSAKSLPWLSFALASERADSLLEAIAAQDRESSRLIELVETRRKELAQANQELEDTNGGVMALYAELDERTQQLRWASELKSRFLSNLSHEVRTPVNSILALSKILLNRLDGELNAEQEKQVTFIRESAEQLLRLVNDELDLAKVEAGKISLNLSTFQLSQVIAALRGMFKPLLSNPAVTLVFDEPHGIPELHSDEGKIAQILRNLISNALKFTPAGEIRVSAHLDSERQAAVINVSDTGIGIAPADQELVFEEFVQVGHEPGARNEGAGIGLHLSRRLAELLGGSLTVTSKPQVGSTFTVTVPVTCPQARPMARAASSGAPGEDALVLVIDDDRVSRYALRQIIGDMNCRIVEAESGAEGLALARSERPKLIFLDLIMTDMSGVDVLKALKGDASTREIPVVVFTSKTLDDAEFRHLAAEASAIVYKADFSSEILRPMIRKFSSEGSGNKEGSAVC